MAPGPPQAEAKERRCRHNKRLQQAVAQFHEVRKAEYSCWVIGNQAFGAAVVSLAGAGVATAATGSATGASIDATAAATAR